MSAIVTPTRRPLARRAINAATRAWLLLRIRIERHDIAMWEFAIATAHVFDGPSEVVDAYTDDLYRRIERAEVYITAATRRLVAAERG